MNLNLTGKRVIVTAAASGIGLEIARAFINEGAQVNLCDINAEALESAHQTLSPTHVALCDATDRTAVDQFIESSVDKLGGLDILVNNAGSANPTGRIEDIDPRD